MNDVYYIQVNVCEKCQHTNTRTFDKVRPELHPVNPLGPIAPKVALLTSYGFVASLFQTKFAHELVFLLVVC